MTEYPIDHSRLKITIERKVKTGYIRVDGTSKRPKWSRRTVAYIDHDDPKFQAILKILGETKGNE